MPKIGDEKKAERKNYILDVAFNLFSKKGYSATGLRDIMKSAKISKGGIYVYFNSKAEILMSIVNRFDEEKYGITSEIDVNKNADEQFKVYMTKRLEAFRDPEYQKWMRVVSEFWSLPHEIPDISSINEERFMTYYNTIEKIIELGISQGIFRSSINVKSFVYQVMCTIDGAGSFYGILSKVISYDQIEDIINVYLYYLKGVEM